MLWPSIIRRATELQGPRVLGSGPVVTTPVIRGGRFPASVSFLPRLGAASSRSSPPASLNGNGLRRVRLVSEPEFARAQVLRDLEDQQAEAEAASGLIPAPQSATEVCPWLDLTQWARYVQGHELAVFTQLAALPDPRTESLLATLVDRVHHLVLQACQSIREKKVNEFDLMRINSVLHRPRVWDRPLFIDVQDATRRRYG
jgi:hypothetical protein